MQPETVEIVSVNTSAKPDTPKKPAPEVTLSSDGIKGDAAVPPGLVTILSREIIAPFEKQLGRRVEPGEFTENITVRGLDLRKVAPLDRFRIGELELEVTQIGKPCNTDTCPVAGPLGRCPMPTDAILCRPVTMGELRPGDTLTFMPRTLCIRIIALAPTATARPHKGKPGPKAKELLDDFFKDKRWHVEIESMTLPEDPDRLKAQLTADIAAGIDVIFTTGSTGIEPTDTAPDVALSVADKTIPGIPEYIRTKYAHDNPHALLSRSVAAVAQQTLIYTLPGSENAVAEYLAEILKTLEHLVILLHISVSNNPT